MRKFKALCETIMTNKPSREEKVLDAFEGLANDLVYAVRRVSNKQEARKLKGKMIDAEERAKDMIRSTRGEVRDTLEDIIRDLAYAINSLTDKYGN